MRLSFLALVCFFAFISCGKNESSNMFAQNRSGKVYVRVARSIASEEFLNSVNFQADHAKSENYLLGYVPSKNFEKISNKDKSNIDVLDEKAWRIQAHDLETLLPIDEGILKSANAEGYHNYAALTAEMQNLAAEFPEHSALSSLGKSVQGREIWMMKVSDNANVEENEPRILLVANMHGDETAGRELMIYLARKLLREYSSSERIRAIVDHAQIYIVSSMNPDGFELMQRENDGGIDLNRNFPEFTKGDDNSSNSRAIETSHLMTLHKQLKFDASLNFHGGAVVFNLPWDAKANRNAATKFGDDALISAMGRAYADKNPTMLRNNGGFTERFDRGLTYGYEWYQVLGGMQDWSITYHSSMHATVEVSKAKNPPSANLPTYWQENQESLLNFIESSMTGIYLDVKDQSGNAVTGIKIKSSASNRELSFDGFVSRPLNATSQEITVSANGYRERKFTLVPQKFSGSAQVVSLERN